MTAKGELLVTQIEEIKSRTGPRDWDNGITKLLFLCTRADALKSGGEELGYFPVAIVAAMETYFKWQIKELIDSKDNHFVSNVRLDDLPIKLSHDILLAIHGKRVTIGELVAHSVRLSNVDAIGRTMGQLLATDFFVLVKEARDPESRRALGTEAPTVIDSADEVFARVKRTFELRHIVCHEAHLDQSFEVGELKKLCSACYKFVLASHYGVTYLVNPSAPLTLNEAYEAAKQRVHRLDKEITAIEERVANELGGLPQRTFCEMEEAWRTFVRKEGEYNASLHMNGSIGAYHEELAIESLYQQRLQVIRNIGGHQRGMLHPKS